MLNNEVDLIKEYIANFKKVNTKVSKVSVGWHLSHSLKVINSVCGALKESNPEEYNWKFNGLRLFVFTLGSFPRGKARSPKRVLPSKIITKVELESQLKSAIENLNSFQNFANNQYFAHPLFKQLNKKKTIKFLRLHTNHHLKIVRDILK